MKTSDFNNDLVKKVSDFHQNHMEVNQIETLSADSCAELLAENNVLSDKVGPKPGFNFRQMLRDGRDGVINLIEGAYQKRPNTRWSIHKIKRNP